MTCQKPPQSDDVGYGKPPKDHQFPPGQSGNPRGRPKGATGGSAIERALKQSVTLNSNGKRRKTTALYAIASQLVESALKGDKGSREFALKLSMSISASENRGPFTKNVSTADGSPMTISYVLSTYSETTFKALGAIVKVNGIDVVATWVVEEALRRLGPEAVAEVDLSKLFHHVEDGAVLERHQPDAGVWRPQ